MLRNVAAVVVHGFLPFEFGTICEVFGHDRSDDGLPPYDFAVVAGEPPPLRSHNDFTIEPPYGLDRLEEADLIALPAVSDARLADQAAPFPAELLAALRRAVGRGARVLSVCSGAFILGEAGLLDGRRCTTHWRSAAELARRYPAAKRRPGRALRGRRPGDHQRGHRGRHRRVPLPGQEGTGLACRQRHRAAHGGPAAPRRRPGAVRRPAGRPVLRRDAAGPARAGCRRTSTSR